MTPKKGLTIIYIGDGKGKTSAAAGLAIRAAGSGFKILFMQFVKGDRPSGERKVLEKLSNVEVKLMGLGFVGILDDSHERSEHVAAAQKALIGAREAIKSEKFNLVVLDEAISAAELGLVSQQDLLKLIKQKPDSVHLCLTGHKRFKKLIAAADLVTEMRMIKHPYYKGILAQRGIDY